MRGDDIQLEAKAGAGCLSKMLSRDHVLIRVARLKAFREVKRALPFHLRTSIERSFDKGMGAGKDAEVAKAVVINRLLIDKILVQVYLKNNRVDDKITLLQAFDNAMKGVSGAFAN